MYLELFELAKLHFCILIFYLFSLLPRRRIGRYKHTHVISVLFLRVLISSVPFLSLSFRTRTRTRLRSALELSQMDPRRETSGRTTQKCTSTWWNTIRLESRTLLLASNQGNCSAIQSYSTKYLLSVIKEHCCLCVCVCVCDSSSETENEWTSSLGRVRSIFSSALYNDTGDGGL